MIIEIQSCIIEWLTHQRVKSAAIQQLNCFHTQGSGVARAIRNKWPVVYDADVAHGKCGDINKLGDFSFVEVEPDKFCYGLYSQFTMGSPKRETRYDAMADGLVKVKNHLLDNNIFNIGVPKRMGSALGGGSWRIVSAIIEDVFENSPIDVTICDHQP